MNSQRQDDAAAAPYATSFSNYKFDFGVAGERGSSTSRPLRDHKPSPSPASSSPSPNSFSPSLQQNNKMPSWTHQPAPPSSFSRSGSSPSMAGDIFGRSWSSSSPSGSTVSGIPNKNPNLFSDLLAGSALGPAGKANPSSLKASSSTVNSVPKSANVATPSSMGPPPPPPPSSLWSEDHLARGFSSASIHGGVGGSTGHHFPMKSTSGPSSVNSKPKGDPFGSLVGLGSKKSSSMAASDSRNNGSKAPSSAFAAAAAASKIPTKKEEFDFGIPSAQNHSDPRPPPQPVPAAKSAAVAADPLEMLFFSSSAPSPTPPLGDNSADEMMFSKESEDWNVGAEESGAAMDLEGLPPPPFGINASAAKNKGSDCYKNGQYADAIKWLSWAVSLLENKSNDNATISEVLSCRASCFKEVGEYKKAIADCSKVLELDGKNVSVLLQRALLYESSEKYRLGAEDLRMVLKIDPGNRLARSTIHRLNKFSD